ncbi:beta-N-acetylhexosaminidase [Elioraea sp.]|uniref:beta-N-acetylhexosaminidase n=1 Tax=Elioraea sp. TaxID=2185103 RepID=UPI0021DEC55F|nr:beta-N-acetylhexosaminidase [Elioraea sp.]GIX11130.1 MAG: beta-N-acetylhexosaminidase [Elioraea sp.]
MAEDPAPKAAIVSLAGPELTPAERRLFRRAPPLGAIMFARNIDNPRQLADLVVEFRLAIARHDAPVLIDQEGGRVARLRGPHWRHPPPAAVFAALYARDPVAARRAAMLNARLIAEDLREAGITVDCAPVLDLPVAGAHDVIGDRAHGSDHRVATALGRAVVRGLQAGGIVPVLKHIPGHGRAAADSHAQLPVVDAPADAILARDARPFAALARERTWGMTAHILFTALDPGLPATISPAAIAFIRNRVGFRGFLVTDDLAMKALDGTPGRLARAAIGAGCDAVLECSGDPARTEAVLAETPPLARAAAARLAAAAHHAAMRRRRLDRARALAALDALLA